MNAIKGVGRQSIRYAAARVRLFDKGYPRQRPWARTHRTVTAHSPVLREGWWGAREGWRETVRAAAYSNRHTMPKGQWYDGR
jgi:hypothetical protein